MTASAKDLMSKKVLTVRPESTCEEALHILVDNHITGLPVVDDEGLLVGIISMFDFLKATLYLPEHETTFFEGPQIQRMLETGTLKLDSVLEAVVSDFMSRNVITVGPDDTQETIVGILKKYKIHRVIVVDPITNKPLGVVSPLDLL